MPQDKETNALWDVKEAAAYLRRSPRWVWFALNLEEDLPGSIPHLRLPCVQGTGNGSPRFIPWELEAWIQQGCPAVSVFRKGRPQAGHVQPEDGRGT